MIRRVGQPPLANKAYRLRPGAYAILPLKGRFLMTAQVAPIFDVQLPGGGIDPGESALQALHREVLEEIGWRIARPGRFGALYICRSTTCGPKNYAMSILHTPFGKSLTPSNRITPP